ncbi:COP1-interacting protein 7 isoform X3 [Magnolia sinica]|uniref:COP1-interacting protein 7 isoform X3 n=1 Tax=Magnolia sinica TaxID=86752 RepID=UPI00265B4BC9|nr:COP1-interacting protein 7 isoform X3 [Magnolia sinica]
MRSETRLESAVFQLTPTRTRCDLVIIANGKTEKIASGLLDPFLGHLKTAQDQIAKGGYSITLKPDPGRDVTWFTKGNVERFVRFVSTPEVLERVNTIESEILQIDDALAIQSNDNLGFSTQVEDHQTKSMGSTEGSKRVLDADADKAIVLFKPGAYPPESNGSTAHEENSKVQLLKVLESRKTVLQKEQGMAFARAVAAGFDMDHMSHLLSFAECFGASRLMDACLRFMELWKRKHETGQWLEVEAADAMSSQSGFSSMNPSGIVLTGEARKQNELREASPESGGMFGTESNGKTSNNVGPDMSSQFLSSDHNRGKLGIDTRPPMDSQVPLSPHEYFQGQFPHPMYPQWPIHSPPGAPIFHAYPVQGMPYYQNYPGSGPFFQTPYPPMDDPRYNGTQRNGQKRHSMDGKNSNVESEAWEVGVSNARSQDGTDQSISELEPQRKVGQAGKKHSGMVVIRNINYITSKRHNTSGSESNSASEPETDEEADDSDSTEKKRKNSARSSKGKGSHTKSSDTCSLNDRVYGRDTDTGNWQAFQNCLLRDGEENTTITDRSMFSAEKETRTKRRQSTAGADPILTRRDSADLPDQRMTEFDTYSGRTARIYKERASNDESAISHEGFHSNGGRGLGNSQLNGQFAEIGGGRGYRRVTNDDFMIYGRGSQSGTTNSLSDPLAGNDFGHADNLDKSSSHNITDESFIVPFRSSSQDHIGTGSRTAIDMDSEFPSALQRTEDSSNKIRSQVNYEPDDLSQMPERGTERESVGYDPAVDYEMQAHAGNTVVLESENQDVVTGVKEGSKKLGKEKKLRSQDALEKRKMDSAIRKGKPSKLNSLAEAQVRAEKLRAFKADLQKMKKEKEEEEMKRLEALKRERQKRIAARGGSSSPAQSPLSSQQTRSRLPTKLSPGLHKGSKFSDSEPGSSSPIQKLPIRTVSVGSNDSQKTTKPSRLNGRHLVGNGLSRSVSSLPELKKENNGPTLKSPEPKAAPIRTRRLSEPKGISSGHASSLKSGSSDPVPKKKLSDEPESKKISAIMNLDRTKSATLPELKIRTSRGNSDMIQNKSARKEIMQKESGCKSSPASESIKVKKSNEKTSHHSSHVDDNQVVEKTVVMLEHDTNPVPIVQTSKEKLEMGKGSFDEDTGEKTRAVAEYGSDCVAASPVIIGEPDQDPSECRLDEKSISHKVTVDSARDELPKSSGFIAAEKPYQAPYARASSLEDPCTRNLQYSKAPPISSEMATSTENVKAHIPNFTGTKSLEQIPETVDKPRDKEASKGFRRLLKFGRKNHTSAAGDHSLDSNKSNIDSPAVDDHTATTASSEVHTLKNLISQDDSPTGGTPHKVSRPFSLLSPFRSKTSEKKIAT